MILVHATVSVAPADLAEALRLSLEHVARSRAEPGCLAHGVHQDGEDPCRLVFVEKWESAEALWQHFRVPESRRFSKALAGLASERPVMDLYVASRLDVPGRGAD